MTGKSSTLRDWVRRPITQRRPVGYDRKLLDAYRPNETFYLTDAGWRARLREIGRTQFDQRPAGTYARDILNRLLIDLSWASSRLEGNTYTRLDTVNLIEHSREAEGKDRLETQILPALRSGFVVLSDRYVYTAFARHLVRGGDQAWIHGVFGFALVPDVVLYLRTDVESLVPRVIASQGMDYWESGMDMHLGSDLYDSFVVYQQRLIDAYDAMAKEHNFVTVDTVGRSIDEIQQTLRETIEPVVKRARKVDPSQLKTIERTVS